MALNLQSRAKRLFNYDGEDLRQLTWQPYETTAQFIGSALPMYGEIVAFVMTVGLLVGAVVPEVKQAILEFRLPEFVPYWSQVPFVPTFVVMSLAVFLFAFVFGEAMSSPEEDLVDNARRGTWYLFASGAIYGMYGINDAVLTIGVTTAFFFLLIAFFSLVRGGG